MGYDSQWGIVSAADVGAPHRRERIWILANTKLYGLAAPQVARGTQETIRKQQAGSHNTFDPAGASGLPTTKSDVANSCGKGLQRSKQFQNDFRENITGKTIPYGSIAKRNNDGGTRVNWWDAEPNVGRVANGVAARVDRLKAIGNGQVPLCAATAWELLK
jgi:DNA (cytosine-5)-methyltransferase 1